MEEWIMGDDDSSAVVVRSSNEAGNRGRLRIFENVGEHERPDSNNENQPDSVTKSEQNYEQEDSSPLVAEDTSGEESAVISVTEDEEVFTRGTFCEKGIDEALKLRTMVDSLTKFTRYLTYLLHLLINLLFIMKGY